MTSVRTAVIDESATGDQEIVALVAEKQIVVLSVALRCAAAVALTWKSDANPLSGAMNFGIADGYALSHDRGVMETNVGEALNLNLGGNVQVSGHLTYMVL